MLWRVALGYWRWLRGTGAIQQSLAVPAPSVWVAAAAPAMPQQAARAIMAPLAAASAHNRQPGPFWTPSGVRGFLGARRPGVLALFAFETLAAPNPTDPVGNSGTGMSAEQPPVDPGTLHIDAAEGPVTRRETLARQPLVSSLSTVGSDDAQAALSEPIQAAAKQTVLVRTAASRPGPLAARLQRVQKINRPVRAVSGVKRIASLRLAGGNEAAGLVQDARAPAAAPVPVAGLRSSAGGGTRPALFLVA